MWDGWLRCREDLGVEEYENTSICRKEVSERYCKIQLAGFTLYNKELLD